MAKAMVFRPDSEPSPGCCLMPSRVGAFGLRFDGEKVQATYGPLDKGERDLSTATSCRHLSFRCPTRGKNHVQNHDLLSFKR